MDPAPRPEWHAPPVEEPPVGLNPSDNEVDDTCDGFDNDVDGQVDEGCYCHDGESQLCYPGHPLDFGVGACAAGVQSCQNVAGDFQLGSWGPCVGAVTPAVEICGNGIDEDCSGTDLACVPPLEPCQPGNVRTCYPGPEQTEGVGLCSAGIQACTRKWAWGDCQDAVTPTDDICENGLDEDCDGRDAHCAGELG